MACSASGPIRSARLLRPFGARAAFGGANRHPRTTVRFPLSHRSDVVLPLKARPKKKRNAKAMTQGLLRAFGARAIAPQWGEPRVLLPQK